jgi:unsaturated chondroitin disaccharide hydrolase
MRSPSLKRVLHRFSPAIGSVDAWAVGLATLLVAGCASAGLGSGGGGAPVHSFGAADIEANLRYAEQQILKTENRIGVAEQPRYTTTAYKGGKWDTAPVTDWRSGFFTGSEWLMYEAFGDNANQWRAKAEERTRAFNSEMSRPQDHDIGFKALATFGLGLRLAGLDEEFRPKILEAANTLAARFSGQYGVTRSWNNEGPDFRVIVDNMMNLELFFLAAELTPKPTDRDRWLSMAVSHAKQTEQNQIRDSDDPKIDGGTCHVYMYNRGVCETRQGLYHGSTWSRGQAWVMYAYAMVFRYAKRWPQYAGDAKLFLATAQRTSDFFLRRLAEPKHGDWIPLHDFDAEKGAVKDTSAAAIAAAALIELATLDEVPAQKRATYRAAAESMLHDLSSTSGAKPYRTNAAPTDLDEEVILLRGTTAYAPYAVGLKEVESGLSYGDHYYIEAMLRLRDAFGDSPRAPGFLSGTRGHESIALAWTGTRGATKYQIKRASNAKGSFAPLTTTTDTRFVDKTAAAGQPFAYQVTATNTAGKESASSNTADLPVSTFSNADIGDSVPAGGSIEENGNGGGTIIVKGAGLDIWGKADACHFFYKAMKGNGTATVRLVSIQDTHVYAKAGIMMRESTKPGSKYVWVGLTPTPGHGYRLQSRSTTDGASLRLKIGNTKTPSWLRLHRNGEGRTFSASYSVDGKTFLSAGTVTVDLPKDILVGLAVSSHAPGSLNSVKFDNLTLPKDPQP